MQMHDPAHPGELLREYLPQGMTISEAAKRLGVTRQAFSALLNGRAGVSAEMALRLADALGSVPDFWLRLQLQRDLWEAQQKPRRKIKRISAFAR